MTKDQYRKAIAKLGLNQVTAARWLGVSVRTSANWAAGGPIPVAVEKLLKLMIEIGRKPGKKE